MPIAAIDCCTCADCCSGPGRTLSCSPPTPPPTASPHRDWTGARCRAAPAFSSAFDGGLEPRAAAAAAAVASRRATGSARARVLRPRRLLRPLYPRLRRRRDRLFDVRARRQRARAEAARDGERRLLGGRVVAEVLLVDARRRVVDLELRLGTASPVCCSCTPTCARGRPQGIKGVRRALDRARPPRSQGRDAPRRPCARACRGGSNRTPRRAGCAAHLKPVAPPARSSVSPRTRRAYTSSAVSAGFGGADGARCRARRSAPPR